VKPTRHIYLFLLFVFALTAAAQDEPKHSQDWFLRASERMNLRQPGSQPFHLQVKFHANAGEEFLAPGEKSQFITGDGSYDEIWLAPDTWRREVTFADYHAVEVQANGIRKMQASSDYEPSRVLMLLRHLMAPIPSNLAEKGSNMAQNWQIDHVTAGTTQLVRLSKVMMADSRITLKDSWYFLPTGELTMSNDIGMTTIWSGVTTFAGKTVPLKMTLKAGDRELLTAIIAIDSAGQIDKAAWDLPGSAAEPGMTLHIINTADVHRNDSIENTKSIFGYYASLQPSSTLVATGVVDRTGAYREVEALLASDPSATSKLFARLRASRTKPATLNKSPCQYSPSWRFLFGNH
jgi:hypothetical protein